MSLWVEASFRIGFAFHPMLPARISWWGREWDFLSSINALISVSRFFRGSRVPMYSK